MNDLDLSSVRAKLSRSAEHAQTIKTELQAWSERNPYSIIQERNSSSTRFSLRLRINEPPPLQRWTLIFSDFLNNLRCTLDHLVFAIAAHQAAPNPPAYEDKLSFPITDCKANFAKSVSNDRRKLGNISDPVRAAIEIMQPYNRPHQDLPPLLGILRDLNNADKHKLIQLAYGAVSSGDIGFVGFPDGSNIKPAALHAGEVKDGTEVFAMLSEVPAPEAKFDRTNFDVIVAVRHGKRVPSMAEGSDRSDIVSIMKLLGGEVRKVIYEVAAKVN